MALLCRRLQSSLTSMKKRTVGIFLFDDAEVLDFAGPFEVFSVTAQIHPDEPFQVFTISKDGEPVRAVNGLRIIPDHSFDSAPPVDVLVVAGGQGTRALLQDTKTLQWLEHVHRQSEWTLSICSAARLFARLGLLEGRPFCTHQEVYDHVLTLSPTALPRRFNRYIQSNERLFTSGGISAGIDLSFRMVATILGPEAARTTAQYMEYPMPEPV